MFGITVEHNHQDAGLLGVSNFKYLVMLGGSLMYICVCGEVVISLYFTVVNVLV